MRLVCAVLVLLAYFEAVHARIQYVGMLPNGANVPNWPAIGHTTPDPDVSGDEHPNQFGKDFVKQGRTWSEALCRMDSDGDGRTNGEELGDPDCVWKVGQIPQQITNITNPGVWESFPPTLSRPTSSPSVNILTPSPSAGSPPVVAPRKPHIKPWKIAHSVLMSLSFGLIIPIGMLVPYYLRNIRMHGQWRRDHMIVMYVGFLLGLVGFLVAVISMGVEQSFHGILGVSLMVMAVFQVAIGVFRHSLPQWTGWKQVHSLIGRILLFVIIIQVISGYWELRRYAAALSFIFGLAHSGLILLALVMIVRAHSRRQRNDSANVGISENEMLPPAPGMFIQLSTANERAVQMI